MKKVIYNFVAPALALTFLLISMAATGGCSFQSTNGEKVDSLFLVNDYGKYYYDLHKPNRKMVLPYELTEVSALSFKKPDILLMVEDETGSIYHYNMSKEKVETVDEFAGDGDYEGVELVGDHIFALESNGNLFRTHKDKEGNLNTAKFETPLLEDNDAEGLGYDPKSNILIIACKEDGDIEENETSGRAIYAYDLEKNKLIEEELFSISDQDLIDFYKREKGVTYDEDRIKFHPSAIALHPIEDRYYILASTGKLLVVTEKDGSIVATYPILSEILNQPEGITFAPDGRMYISSEGEGGDGFVLRYRMMEH